MRIECLPCGECALTVQLGYAITEPVADAVRAFAAGLEGANLPGIRELVPTYCTVMVHYDPVVWGFEPLAERLTALAEGLEAAAAGDTDLVEIPVLYGGEAGPDLSFVAEHNGLTPEEVIRRHAAPAYLVYMLGFTPGFPYLGGMDESIAAPRLKTPRVRIPAGSVGIAGSQTGVYPIDSPGGWQLIGRTPLRLFDMDGESKFLLKAGQRVRFVPIDEAEFRRLGGVL